jgi:DNA-binding transcriptional regulator YdaS (Cro superfamily)
MHLDTYLHRDDALSIAELRTRIGVKSDMQIRQWRHGYAGRQPSPQLAVALEQATGGMVRRWDSRPDDWHLIWPELIGAEGAPSIAASEPARVEEGA